MSNPLSQELICGEALETLRGMEDASVDALVTDPPAGIEFMSRTWDRFSTDFPDPAFLNWFAGFVDGEGCFSVHKKQVKGYETYDCQFSITLRNDDKPILLEIQRTLGIGTIAERSRKDGGANPQVRYCVSSKRECSELVRVLRAAPLRAKKALDFETWVEALNAWASHEVGEWSDMAISRHKLMSERQWSEFGKVAGPPDRRAFIATLKPIFAECLRVLKPGGHGLVWALPRTSHWTGTALEDAGFEIRDRITHLFGCLSADTEILINGQWEPYHKAEIGNLALCYDQDAERFRWEPIRRVYIYPDYDDTVYRIQGDNTDQIVTKEHRCLVERGGTYVFMLAEEAARQREARVPILENLPDLLEALSMPDKGTGGEGQILLSSVLSKTNGTAKTETDLSDMRQRIHAKGRKRVVKSEVLQPELLCGMAANGSRNSGSLAADSPTRPGSMDRTISQELSEEDVRIGQSGMEGWGDLVPEERQLQADQVRSLPDGVSADGPEGWLCDGASIDRSESYRPPAISARNRSSRRSRSQQQCYSEPPIIQQQSGSQTVRASRYTRPDVVRFEPIHYRGIVWCVEVPTGAFVARRNGQVFITGNSGFPKSLNVSKAMDKAAGVEREVVGRRTDRAATPIQDLSGQAYNTQPLNTFDGSAITAPATDLAKQWDGWGTALKPGGEDWWLVRKPLIGTVAANVERFGTGALNIAGCRIDSGEDYTALRVKQGAKDRIYGGGSGLRSTATTFDPASGRWPANVTLDESAAAALDAQSGELSASWGRSTRGRAGMFGPDGGGVAIRCSEGGGASRFYYTAKASSAERSEGVDGRNIHPTVKPVDLMRWLCRLITPPGGTIVDPFMGSGTTGVAARDEGFGFIGIERDPESFAIAEQRLAQTGMAL